MSKDIKYEVCASLDHPEIKELNKLLNGIFDLSRGHPGLIKFISSQEGEADSFIINRPLNLNLEPHIPQAEKTWHGVGD